MRIAIVEGMDKDKLIERIVKDVKHKNYSTLYCKVEKKRRVSLHYEETPVTDSDRPLLLTLTELDDFEKNIINSHNGYCSKRLPTTNSPLGKSFLLIIYRDEYCKFVRITQNENVIRNRKKTKCTKGIECVDIASFIRMTMKRSIDMKEKEEPYNIYYRGQLLWWSLLPSLFRSSEWVKNEPSLNANIICSRPNDFLDCHSTFDKLVKLKHFEQPSRLMDITSNPLIALYFACDVAKKTADQIGTVYEIFSEVSEEKYSSISDTVVMLSSITNSTHRGNHSMSFAHLLEEKKIFRSYSSHSRKCAHPGCYGCRLGTALKGFSDAYKDCNIFLGEIIYQAKKESGTEGYWDDLTYKELDTAMLVHPPMNNNRIIQQQGSFLMCGINPADFNAPPEQYYEFFNPKSESKDLVDKQIIFYFLKEDVDEIMKGLEFLGINDYYIYNELDKNIRVLKEQYIQK